MANPVLDQLLFKPELNKNWHMSFAERIALMHVLGIAKPEISIEIGTFMGGSLRPISNASDRVYSFDIDENQHRHTHNITNVEYITGDTQDTLPSIIELLNAGSAELNFILIDGSHETDGVRSDIENCLVYRPKKRPTYILMHDSGNGAVRDGILSAPWVKNAYVHALDMDFVNALLYDRADIENQVWGGLALAVLLPNKRVGDIVTTNYFEYSLNAFSRQVKPL